MNLRFSWLVFSLLLSGCASLGSVLAPYKGNFMCEDTDDFGRCQNVTKAYEEAISSDMVETDETEIGQSRDTYKEARNAYKESEYHEMRKLIDEPVTPLVKQPKVLRTLVAAYSSGDNTLFSPRYMWFFVDSGNFVLGDAPYQDFNSGSSLLTPFADAGEVVE